ncbi:MAG: hypothetical protein ACKO96_09840, partial [Flammeovirgaceae bacterium]
MSVSKHRRGRDSGGKPTAGGAMRQSENLECISRKPPKEKTDYECQYDKNGQYIAVGHEIIHARDYDSGFMSSIDRKYTQSEVRDVIKEHRAYLWSS